MPDNSKLSPILAYFGLAFLGFLIAMLIMTGLGSMWQVDLTDKHLLDTLSGRRLSWMLIIQQSLLFIIPAFLVRALYPKLSTTFSLSNQHFTQIGLIILFFICALPLVSYLQWLNTQFQLTDQLGQMEDSSNQKIKQILSSGNGLWIVFVMGVIPALGEELVFRGVIQKSLSNWWKNKHLAVLVSGVLFSAIHLQFAGFLPRAFLGILLGYAYLFSGRLWVSILLHFGFNAVQAVMMIQNPDLIETFGDFSTIEPPEWSLVLSSILLVVGLFYFLHKNYQAGLLKT